jgi:UDP-N-acetylmuramoyl-tripeptide--D-alanyl-D-alanine ligase
MAAGSLGRTKVAALIGAAVAATIAVLWWQLGERHYFRLLLESPRSGSCKRELTSDVLRRSQALATRFLLAHQKPAGNFDYEYDFQSKALSNDDNEVRQAGALWGLALSYAHEPSAELEAAVERGLAFFDQSSRRARGGRRCVAYAGADIGSTGTLALLALSYIDYLRAQPPGANDARNAQHRVRLAEYLKQLEKSQRRDGLFFGRYDTEGCAPQGEASPYADGEALLALVKAFKYLGFSELQPTLLRAAAAGRRLNIDAALEQDGDSNTTKGYYQWSSMAFYELATSNIPDMASYGDTVLRLADWMIDVHGTLWRLRNTGYAYEGIVHAYALAKQRNDARAAKYACVIDVGLSRLLSWQVGGPLASSFANRGASDKQALGGAMNEARDSALRIDVTQHQSHALVLALRYVYAAD